MKKALLKLKNKRNFSGRKIINFFIEFFYLLAIFLSPFFISVFLKTGSAFELQNIFLLRILLAFVLFLTVFKELYFPSKNIIKQLKLFKKYLYVPALFILFLTISLFFSSDIVYSFFGSSSYKLGYLNYLMFFAWFLLLCFNLLSYKNEGRLNSAIKRILYTLMASAFFISLYGLIQFFAIDFYSLTNSTIRNSISNFSSLEGFSFQASWLLLVLPLSLWFFYKEKKNYLKYGYLLIFLTILFNIIFSANVGALLSLVLFLPLLSLYLIFSLPSKKSKKKVISVLLIVFFFIALITLKIDSHRESYFSAELGSSYSFSSNTAINTRLEAFKTASLAIKEKPFFGHGQDNTHQAFISLYEPNWILHNGVFNVLDRAHNLVLDVLLGHGFVGLLFFACFYFYIFYLNWRNIKKEDVNDPSLALALGLGLFIYLFSLLFNFSTITTQFYVFIYLALFSLLHFKNYSKSSSAINKDTLKKRDDLLTANNENTKSKRKSVKIISISLALIFCSLLIIFASNELLANSYFLEAREKFNDDKFSESIVFLGYIDELKINPVARSFYDRESASWQLDLYPYKEELVLNSFLKKELELSLDNIRTKQPRDILLRAEVLNALGKTKEANLLMAELKELNPNYPETLLAEARILLEQKKEDEAIDTYKLLISKLPSSDHSNLKLIHKAPLVDLKKEVNTSIADIYFNQKKYSLAEDYYRQASIDRHSGYSDFKLLKKLANTLYLQNKFSEALVEVEKGIKRSPFDYDFPLLAYYIHTELGEEVLAESYYESAKQLGFK